MLLVLEKNSDMIKVGILWWKLQSRSKFSELTIFMVDRTEFSNRFQRLQISISENVTVHRCWLPFRPNRTFQNFWQALGLILWHSPFLCIGYQGLIFEYKKAWTWKAFYSGKLRKILILTENKFRLASPDTETLNSSTFTYLTLDSPTLLHTAPPFSTRPHLTPHGPTLLHTAPHSCVTLHSNEDRFFDVG